jgi:hypothetical protein
MEPRSASEIVNSILEGHRRSHYNLQEAVNLLHMYTLQQSDETKQEIFRTLWFVLATEPQADRPAHGHVIPGVHSVVIRSVATFGPTAELPGRVFSLLRWDDPTTMEFWARRICSQLDYSMFHNAGRFAQSALDQTKALCGTYTFVGATTLTGLQWPQSVIDAAGSLEKTVEHIEYARFAASLQEAQQTREIQVPELDQLLGTLGLPNNVAAAIEEARRYLQRRGLFEPKIAADLIRTSIDEIHRALVVELEKMTAAPCRAPDKDGGRRAYMREAGFISQPEEEFFSSIYSLVSKEGTHKLVAERETVLFLLEMVRHYLLLLLRRLLARRTAPPTGTVP